jgi:hypothetical protein
MANRAKVCGIVGVVLSVFPLTVLFGLFVSIAAVVLGIKALRSDQTVAAGATDIAKLGIRLGCVGIGFVIVLLLFVLLLFYIANQSSDNVPFGESLIL